MPRLCRNRQRWVLAIVSRFLKTNSSRRPASKHIFNNTPFAPPNCQVLTRSTSVTKSRQEMFRVVRGTNHQIGVNHILALSLLPVTLPICYLPSAYLKSHDGDGLLSVPDDCRVVVAGGGKQAGACLKGQSVDLEKTAVVSLRSHAERD